ncbi:MAG: LysR family transcriptional regulator [Dongiaceae bacterium]
MLREIRTFVAVAETGSIKAAARRLRLTQPAITRQIQRLESALGTAVLDRQVRPPALAPAGRALLERCRQILRSVDDLRTLASAGAEPAGRFRLGIGPAFCDSTSVDPLVRLRQIYPRLDLQVTSDWSTVMFDEVRAGRLDAAVGVWPNGSGSPGGLNARVFGADRLVVVAPRGESIGGRVHLAKLGSRSWILNPDGCGFRAKLRTALMKAGESLNVGIETPRFELQLDLVSHGLGIGLVPQRALRRSPRRQALQTIQVTGLNLDIRYMVVDAGLAANLMPVVDFLRDSFARAASTHLRHRGR